MLLADEVAQIALSGHEGHDRDRPVGVLRLYQLRQLRTLVVDEVHVAGAAGQPQDQLVEEQHDRVVAEPLGVLAHDGESGVEVHEGLAARRRHPGVVAEVGLDQPANQALPLLALRRFERRRLKGPGVPLVAEVAPAIVAGGRALVQVLEEGIVAHLGAEAAGILEQLLAEVEARRRRRWLDLADMGCVAAQDGAGNVLRPDHVVGHHQEAFPAEPAVVLRHHARELRHAAGLGVAGQQQVQHRHKVRLTGAERSVEVAGGALAALDRALDEAERLIEGLGELRRDDVALDGLGRAGLGDAVR
ncbi:hypothetical protein [Siccirubricoccus sp. G192]|uniref:hypothetical protein n=1 Tax=Siccirubricoccus sp. G192 TaxID=2849651 RepID=UPI001C2B8A2A|nr:hypothetical protein [Siccirubricoccus sp. G192]MBV1800483.1 hypothetical protein [Siccirubricoccus sp. G192]